MQLTLVTSSKRSLLAKITSSRRLIISSTLQRANSFKLEENFDMEKSDIEITSKSMSRMASIQDKSKGTTMS